MKLSEMNTEQLADVLLEIAEPVSNIVCDDETTEGIKQIEMKRSNIYNIGVMANNLLPLLLKKHAEDTYKIVAVLSGKTVQQIREQKGIQTIADVKDCFDKDLLDFFTSSASTAVKR